MIGKKISTFVLISELKALVLCSKLFDELNLLKSDRSKESSPHYQFLLNRACADSPKTPNKTKNNQNKKKNLFFLVTYANSLAPLSLSLYR